MYVVMAYDVGVERVMKVLKVGRKYLSHVQNSLLEGELTPAKLKELKGEVLEIIDQGHDVVTFYSLYSKKCFKRKTFGSKEREPKNIV